MAFRIGWLALLALLAPCTVAAGEVEQREQLVHQAATLYRAENFAELDRLFDKARSQGLRTPSGLWQLWLLHNGVKQAEDRPHTNTEAEAQAQRAKRWIAQRPQSVTAPLVLAEVELRHARALGCGECTVIAESERSPLYFAALGQAEQLFDAAKAKSSVDPQWYADMLEVGRLRRWGPALVDEVLVEAERKAPGYYTIWFNAVDFYFEQGDKAPPLIDAMARRAVTATKGKEGNGLYARVWWYAAQMRYGPHLFEQAPISWKDFDAGARDVMARYPDDWNRNNFANFACNAKHPERARALMKGFEPLPEAWDSFELYAQCVQPEPEAPTLDT